MDIPEKQRWSDLNLFIRGLPDPDYVKQIKEAGGQVVLTTEGLRFAIVRYGKPHYEPNKFPINHFELTTDGLQRFVSVGSQIFGNAMQAAFYQSMDAEVLNNSKGISAVSEAINIVTQAVEKTYINTHGNGSYQNLTGKQVAELQSISRRIEPAYTFQRGNRVVVGKSQNVIGEPTQAQKDAFGPFATNPSTLYRDSTGVAAPAITTHGQDGTGVLLGIPRLFNQEVFVTPVHDGFYCSPDNANTVQQEMNRAMYEATNQNTMKAIYARAKATGAYIHKTFGLGKDWKDAFGLALVAQFAGKDLKGKEYTSAELKQASWRDDKNIGSYARDFIEGIAFALDIKEIPEYNSRTSYKDNEEKIRNTIKLVLDTVEDMSLLSGITNQVLADIPTSINHMSVLPDQGYQNKLYETTQSALVELIDSLYPDPDNRPSTYEVLAAWINGKIKDAINNSNDSRLTLAFKRQVTDRNVSPMYLDSAKQNAINAFFGLAMQEAKKAQIIKRQIIGRDEIVAIAKAIQHKITKGNSDIFTQILHKLRKELPTDINVVLIDDISGFPEKANATEDIRGFYDQDDNTIYVLDNGSGNILDVSTSESNGVTLFHELHHALWTDTFYNFAHGDFRNIKDAERVALENVERLLNEFANSSTVYQNTTVDKFKEILREILGDDLGKEPSKQDPERRAEFLDEAFAYINSNWYLFNRLSEISVLPKDQLNSFTKGQFARFMKLIKNLWTKFLGNVFGSKPIEDFARAYALNTFVAVATHTYSNNPRGTGRGRKARKLNSTLNRGVDLGLTPKSRDTQKFYTERQAREKFLGAASRKLAEADFLKNEDAKRNYAFKLAGKLTPFLDTKDIPGAVTDIITLMDVDTIGASDRSKLKNFTVEILKQIDPYDFSIDKKDPDANNLSVRLYDFLQEKDGPIQDEEYPATFDKSFEKTVLIAEMAKLNPQVKSVINKVKAVNLPSNKGKNIFEKLENSIYDSLDKAQTLQGSFSEEFYNAAKRRLDLVVENQKNLAQDIEDTLFQTLDKGLIWGINHFPFQTAFNCVTAIANAVSRLFGGKGNIKPLQLAKSPGQKALLPLAHEGAMGLWLTGVAGQLERLASKSSYPMVMGRLRDVFLKSGYTLALQEKFKVLKGQKDKERQEQLEKLPQELERNFKKTKINNWTRELLYRGLIKTNITILDKTKAFKYFSDSKLLDTDIADIESHLDPNNKAYYLRKIKEAVRYSLHLDNAAPNLLLSPHEIAIAAGETNALKTDSVNDHYISMLMSMYTIKYMNQSAKDSIAKIYTDDTDAMDTLYKEIFEVRKFEENDSNTSFEYRYHASYNGWSKGLNKHSDLIYVPKREIKKYISLGYKYLQDYKNTAGDVSQPMVLMYTENHHNRDFLEGLMQTINQTAFDYQLVHKTRAEISNTSIEKSQSFQRMRRNPYSNNPDAINPIPIFNEHGQPVAFDRSVPKEYGALVDAGADVFTAIAQQKQRRLRETFARDFNKDTLNLCKKYWDEATPEERKTLFVDVFNSDDPTIREAITRIDKKTRLQIERVFGGRHFYVRKSELYTIIGYRRKSLVDTKDNTFPLPDEANAAISFFLEKILGERAADKILNAEAFLSGAATYVRNTIVIRSGVVPLANLVNNIIMLHTVFNIPFSEMIRLGKDIFVQTEKYNRLSDKLFKIERDLVKAEDPKVIQQLEASKKHINDLLQTLDILPLIESGMYSTISEKGHIIEEIDFAKGTRIGSAITTTVEKLPKPLRDVSANILMTPQSGAYKLAIKAVNYSDWIAKAITVKYLTEASKYQKTEINSTTAKAYADILFIDYDQFTTPGVDYLNRMGQSWFMMYKYRIFAAACFALMFNPSKSLLGAGLATTMGVGTALTDNAFTKAISGTLGFSWGPGVLFRGLMMHPLAVALGFLL